MHAGTGVANTQLQSSVSASRMRTTQVKAGCHIVQTARISPDNGIGGTGCRVDAGRPCAMAMLTSDVVRIVQFAYKCCTL